MLEEQLKKFGLSEKEAKTYMTLLVLGESSATRVAEESGIKRSSAYVVLEALQKKGLATVVEGNGTQLFKAAPPEKLAQIAEENLKKHKEVHQTIENLIPELKGFQSENKYTPKVRIFEGKEQLRKCFEELYNVREKKVRIVSNIQKMSKIIPLSFVVKFIKTRLSKGVIMKGIHPDDKVAKILMPISKLGKDDPVLIPASKYNIAADFVMFDDTIGVMTSEGGGYAVSIESKEISSIMKDIFDLAHKEAKRLQDSKN